MKRVEQREGKQTTAGDPEADLRAAEAENQQRLRNLERDREHGRPVELGPDH